MNLAFTLLHMNIRAGLNAFRETRIRILAGIAGLFLLGYNLAVAYFLLTRLLASHTSGTFLPWLMMGICWLFAGMLSFISTWQYWLNPDRVLGILLLPLRPAALFRSLVLATIVSRAGPRILSLMGGLLFVLAWWNPLFFVIFLSGLPLAICCGMVLSWLCYLWITTTLHIQVSIGAGVMILAGALAWLILHTTFATTIPALQSTTACVISAGLLLFSLLLFFTCGSSLGKLYITTYQKTLSQSKRHTDLYAPGIEALARTLARYSPIMAALLFKDLLAQSRNNLNILRAVLFLVSIAGFALLTQFILLPAHRAPVPLVITYGTILGLYFFLDATPSPVGSEGNRLTLYLITPSSTANFLWAKLVLYLGTVSGITLPLSLTACLFLHLSIPTTLLTLTFILLINGGITLIIVWGSTWDEDIHLAIEGGVQAMLYEQLPSTPRRLAILLAGMLFASLCLLITWQWFSPAELLLLLCFDLTLGFGLWLFSRYCLDSLIKRG